MTRGTNIGSIKINSNEKKGMDLESLESVETLVIALRSNPNEKCNINYIIIAINDFFLLLSGILLNRKLKIYLLPLKISVKLGAFIRKFTSFSVRIILKLQ